MRSSRSTPRSSAKWFRVPAGMHTNGTPCSEATPATSAWEPSPPAMPITSAPPAIASRASCSRSSPRSSMTVSIPRAWASAVNSASAFPPPDHRLRISTGRVDASTAVPRADSSCTVAGSLRRAARVSAAETRTSTTAMTIPPSPWFRSNVATATTRAATATRVATRRTTPRRVTTYHAATSATANSASAPRSGAQLFHSTTTVTASAATPHTRRRPRTAARASAHAATVPPCRSEPVSFGGVGTPRIDTGPRIGRVRAVSVVARSSAPSRRRRRAGRPGCGTGRCRRRRRAAAPRGGRSR